MPIAKVSEKSMALLINSAKKLGVSVKDVIDSLVYESLGKPEEQEKESKEEPQRTEEVKEDEEEEWDEDEESDEEEW